jgi:hypothetical protein
MKKKQFRIQVKETGDVIEYFETIAEARHTLAQFEEEDKKDDVYVPDFYEIAELTLDNTYTPVES